MATATATVGKAIKGSARQESGKAESVSHIESAPLRSIGKFDLTKGGSSDHRIGSTARRFLAETTPAGLKGAYDSVVNVVRGLSAADARAVLLSAASAYNWDALVKASQEKPAGMVKLSQGEDAMIVATLKSQGQAAADSLRNTLLAAKRDVKAQGIKVRKPKAVK
jgi:hypothetical protein